MNGNRRAPTGTDLKSTTSRPFGCRKQSVADERSRARASTAAGGDAARWTTPRIEATWSESFALAQACDRPEAISQQKALCHCPESGIVGRSAKRPSGWRAVHVRAACARAGDQHNRCRPAGGAAVSAHAHPIRCDSALLFRTIDRSWSAIAVEQFYSRRVCGLAAAQLCSSEQADRILVCPLLNPTSVVHGISDLEFAPSIGALAGSSLTSSSATVVTINGDGTFSTASTATTGSSLSSSGGIPAFSFSSRQSGAGGRMSVALTGGRIAGRPVGGSPIRIKAS